MRSAGGLSPLVLHRLRQYFRIKNIYHSNAIEGNQLNVGETRQVVELGLTITGKSLKDQAEAKNLADAVDFLEELGSNSEMAIRELDIRQLHTLVLKGIDDENAGRYRLVHVEISGSDYKPPGAEKLQSEMEALGEWISTASCPTDEFASVQGLVRAAVAHAWLVYVHPFIDGNGRVARLLMNLILMRYGFPIAIITREDRLRYYDALEASQTSDISSFISLLSECVQESLDEYEGAAEEQREREEWAQSLAARFVGKEKVKIANEYEVWRSALDLLKSYVRQTADMIDSNTPLGNVHFRDFGSLEFEKYLSLRGRESAKKTWFFRIDFVRGDRAVRYLFFFGFSGPAIKDICPVTLHVARENPPGSYYYEHLDRISTPNVPSLSEIGYDAKGEEFVARSGASPIERGKIEVIGKRFFEEVIKFHFTT
jgi:Fic family protein